MKTKKAKKTGKTKTKKETGYPCVNCGFVTNGDFLCKCGEVLCESCSGDHCNTCKDKKERKYDDSIFKDDYYEDMT
jgi:hypothetical protein